MNIIKFNQTLSNNQFFDKNLLGKYAYAVSWLYAFPFDKINLTEVQNIENQTTSIEQSYIEGVDYVKINDYITHIDQIGTSKANSISRWSANNTFVPDGPISTSELRSFRNKLADFILQTYQLGESYDFDWYTDDNTKIVAMLTYYKNGMTDCTIAGLSRFTNTSASQSITTGTGCGCGVSSPSYSQVQQTVVATPTVNGSSSIISKSAGCGCGSSSIYSGISTSVCDPIALYRTGMYNYMVSVFSDIDFWTYTDQIDVCRWMKTRIDEIIRLNFPLASSMVDKFADCTCSNPNSSEQERLMQMLSNLSIALDYIINNQVSGNRNFITNSFTNWATYLYEKMQWE